MSKAEKDDNFLWGLSCCQVAKTIISDLNCNPSLTILDCIYCPWCGTKLPQNRNWEIIAKGLLANVQDCNPKS